MAAAGPAEALRLAQCGAVPALVQAVCGPNADVATNAGDAVAAVASAAPDVVAGAANRALVAALRGEDSCAAASAAWVLSSVAKHSPERVAAEPGALQALCSTLRGTAIDTITRAAVALCLCARGSPDLARRVADTPGVLAALVAVVASSNARDQAEYAMFALHQVAVAGTDLAARVISTPGALQALSQAVLLCSNARVAQSAAAVLAVVARAGPEHATTIAEPNVLAALVSVSGRAGMGVKCMLALVDITHVSPHLALRVADTPGAEAAMLAALTCNDLETAKFAATALEGISRADAERIARLLSAPDVPAALLRLLQSDHPLAVVASTCLLARADACGVQMVTRLLPLPGAVLRAWSAVLGGADSGPANAAAIVLSQLAWTGGDQASLVISTPGFSQAVASALGNTTIVASTLVLLCAVATAGPALAGRVAAIPEVFPAVARALQSSETGCAGNAAAVLSRVCAADAGLARRAVAAPGVLRALVAMLQRGPGYDGASNAASALANMAGGFDGLRPDLASRLAAEDGLLPALAAFAQRSSGLQAIPAVRALAAVACAGGADLASLVGRTEGAIPALVRALREADDAELAIIPLNALGSIAAASPQDLGRRILDAGAARAAVAASALDPPGLAPPQAALVAGPFPATGIKSSIAALLETLAAIDAAAVTAALVGLLAHCGTGASDSVRRVMADFPLPLGPAALEVLARQVEATAQLRSREAALEALAAASAVEADAVRPRLCAACGLQRPAAGAGRLRPCGGCSGKGPAGRVLYCGADCQRAHWPVHRAYCKQAAAVAAAADKEEAVPGGTA